MRKPMMYGSALAALAVFACVLVGSAAARTLAAPTVTNFTPKTDFQGSRENLHLIERWTRLDSNTIEYVVKIEDPSTWTRSWTIKQELSKQSDQANRNQGEPNTARHAELTTEPAEFFRRFSVLPNHGGLAERPPAGKFCRCGS